MGALSAPLSIAVWAPTARYAHVMAIDASSRTNRMARWLSSRCLQPYCAFRIAPWSWQHPNGPLVARAESLHAHIRKGRGVLMAWAFGLGPKAKVNALNALGSRVCFAIGRGLGGSTFSPNFRNLSESHLMRRATAPNPGTAGLVASSRSGATALDASCGGSGRPSTRRAANC